MMKTGVNETKAKNAPSKSMITNNKTNARHSVRSEASLNSVASSSISVEDDRRIATVKVKAQSAPAAPLPAASAGIDDINLIMDVIKEEVNRTYLRVGRDRQHPDRIVYHTVQTLQKSFKGSVGDGDLLRRQLRTNPMARAFVPPEVMPSNDNDYDDAVVVVDDASRQKKTAKCSRHRHRPMATDGQFHHRSQQRHEKILEFPAQAPKPEPPPQSSSKSHHSERRGQTATAHDDDDDDDYDTSKVFAIPADLWVRNQVLLLNDKRPPPPKNSNRSCRRCSSSSRRKSDEKIIEMIMETATETPAAIIDDGRSSVVTATANKINISPPPPPPPSAAIAKPSGSTLSLLKVTEDDCKLILDSLREIESIRSSQTPPMEPSPTAGTGSSGAGTKATFSTEFSLRGEVDAKHQQHQQRKGLATSKTSKSLDISVENVHLSSIDTAELNSKIPSMVAASAALPSKIHSTPTWPATPEPVKSNDGGLFSKSNVNCGEILLKRKQNILELMKMKVAASVQPPPTPWIKSPKVVIGIVGGDSKPPPPPPPPPAETKMTTTPGRSNNDSKTTLESAGTNSGSLERFESMKIAVILKTADAEAPATNKMMIHSMQSERKSAQSIQPVSLRRFDSMKRIDGQQPYSFLGPPHPPPLPPHDRPAPRAVPRLPPPVVVSTTTTSGSKISADENDHNDDDDDEEEEEKQQQQRTRNNQKKNQYRGRSGGGRQHRQPMAVMSGSKIRFPVSNDEKIATTTRKTESAVVVVAKTPALPATESLSSTSGWHKKEKVCSLVKLDRKLESLVDASGGGGGGHKKPPPITSNTILVQSSAEKIVTNVASVSAPFETAENNSGSLHQVSQRDLKDGRTPSETTNIPLGKCFQQELASALEKIGNMMVELVGIEKEDERQSTTQSESQLRRRSSSNTSMVSSSSNSSSSSSNVTFSDKVSEFCQQAEQVCQQCDTLIRDINQALDFGSSAPEPEGSTKQQTAAAAAGGSTTSGKEILAQMQQLAIRQGKLADGLKELKRKIQLKPTTTTNTTTAMGATSNSNDQQQQPLQQSQQQQQPLPAAAAAGGPPLVNTKLTLMLAGMAGTVSALAYALRTFNLFSSFYSH